LECLIILAGGSLSVYSAPADVSVFIKNIFQHVQWKPSFSPKSVARVHQFVLRAARSHLEVLHTLGLSGGRPSGSEILPALQTSLGDRLYSSWGGVCSRPPPLLADLVALPKSPPSRCLVLDHLPPLWRDYYADPARVLLPPAEAAAQRRLQPTLRPFVGASFSELCKLYLRLTTLQMVGWTVASRAKVLNGVFAVPKDTDSSGNILSQRFIVDCRLFNLICKLSEGLELVSPADLARLRTEPQRSLYIMKFDLSNFYHHLFVPPWMHLYLCLPPVRAHAMGPDYSAQFGGPDVLITPYCLSLPMGFLNAVHIAQHVNEFVLASTPLFALRPIGPTQDGDIGIGRRGIYIDDAFAVSYDKSQLDRCVPAMHSAYRAANLEPNSKKEVLPCTSAQILGLEFDGTRHIIRPRPEKLILLIQATRWVLLHRFSTGRALQMLVSHWMWFCLLVRPSLCILSAVFAFINKFSTTRRPQLLWHNVRGELEALCRLAPLFEAHLDAPLFSKVLCTDASTVGGAVCSTPLTESMRSQLHVWISERRAFDVNSRSASMFSSVFPSQIWRTMFSFTWAFPEHINVLELRTLLDAVRWVISHPGDSLRVPAFVDSQVVQAIVSKGRTSSRSLVYVLRHLSCLLLATGISLSCFYVPSALNPADAPSRHPRPLRNVWDPD